MKCTSMKLRAVSLSAVWVVLIASAASGATLEQSLAQISAAVPRTSDAFITAKIPAVVQASSAVEQSVPEQAPVGRCHDVGVPTEELERLIG